MTPGLRLTVLVVGFTVASGLLDALAFSYAAGMWRDGRLVASVAAKSAGSFARTLGPVLSAAVAK